MENVKLVKYAGFQKLMSCIIIFLHGNYRKILGAFLSEGVIYMNVIPIIIFHFLFV